MDDPGHRSLHPSGVDVAIWAGALVALVATIWLSLGAPPDADDVVVSDKLAHAVVYAVDTFLLLLAVVWRPGRPQALVGWMVPIVLFVAVLGGLIELAQDAISRDADPLDWVADLIGIAVATVAFSLLRSRSAARSEGSSASANEPARGA